MGRCLRGCGRAGGRLDILVNDVWGGDALTEWEHPVLGALADERPAIQRRGVHTHIITSYAAPPMIARARGLIVEITDGDDPRYRGSLFYDLAKSSVIRLALAMAEELRPHGIRPSR